MLQRLLPYRPERDAYRLLQLNPTATSTEIVEACRRLARTFHPDRNASQRATEEMQVVNAVRQLLTDPGARAEYDRERRRWLAVEEARRHARVASLPGSRLGADRLPRASAAWTSMPVSHGEMHRFTIHASAIWAGVRAALVELGPPRCGTCTAVIELGDSFCPLCGTRLLTTSGPPAGR
jgi:curved DNA-binding protein CbpA